MSASLATTKYVTQAQFGEFVQQINSQFERLIDLFEERFEEIHVKLDKIEERLDRLEADVADIKADQRVLKSWVTRIDDTVYAHSQQLAS